MKSKKWLCILIAVAVACVAGTVVAEEGASSEEKVAVVNGVVITKADFEREVARVQRSFLGMGGPHADTKLSKLREQVLDNLIEIELLYRAGLESGIDIEEQALEEQVNMLRTRFPDESEFEKALGRAGMSLDGLKENMVREMTIQRFINEKFAGTIAVSDEEVKKYYEDNAQFFMQPEQISARHILIKVSPDADEATKSEARSKIDEVQKRLEEGEDFGTVAKERSEGPSAQQGGDLGYFSRGQMVKPFEDAAFALNVGEMSDVVETQFGYHIIKVDDKKPESKVPFEDIDDRIRDYLKQDKLKTQVRDYIAQLKAKADVQKFLPETEEKP
ncbi:MAG: peptidylprolyl isomerase [Candidatus Abyssubacteria bacterium]